MSVVKFTTKGKEQIIMLREKPGKVKGALSSSFLIYYCSSSRSIVMKQQQLSKKMTTSGFIFQIIISYSSVLYIRINWNHADTRRATTAKEPDADSTTQPTNDSGISE